MAEVQTKIVYDALLMAIWKQKPEKTQSKGGFG